MRSDHCTVFNAYSHTDCSLSVSVALVVESLVQLATMSAADVLLVLCIQCQIVVSPDLVMDDVPVNRDAGGIEATAAVCKLSTEELCLLDHDELVHKGILGRDTAGESCVI
jgi:hypothetical protein